MSDTVRLRWGGLEFDCPLQPEEPLLSALEESLARLQAVRAKAIAREDGFKLDAEIESPEFGKRWIRISATIERRNGEPIRLFGIKQDITEEKKTFEHMRHLAEHDDGYWGRAGLADRHPAVHRLRSECRAQRCLLQQLHLGPQHLPDRRVRPSEPGQPVV